MTETARCYENTITERVNGILKQEYALDGVFRSGVRAEKVIEGTVYLFNTKRPHLALKYKTPAAIAVGLGLKSVNLFQYLTRAPASSFRSSVLHCSHGRSPSGTGP